MWSVSKGAMKDMSRFCAQLNDDDDICWNRPGLGLERFYLLVGGGSVWSAFCQVRFEFSLHHSNGHVGRAVGDMNLGCKDKFECCNHVEATFKAMRKQEWVQTSRVREKSKWAAGDRVCWEDWEGDQGAARVGFKKREVSSKKDWKTFTGFSKRQATLTFARIFWWHCGLTSKWEEKIWEVTAILSQWLLLRRAAERWSISYGRNNKCEGFPIRITLFFF